MISFDDSFKDILRGNADACLPAVPSNFGAVTTCSHVRAWHMVKFGPVCQLQRLLLQDSRRCVPGDAVAVAVNRWRQVQDAQLPAAAAACASRRRCLMHFPSAITSSSITP